MNGTANLRAVGITSSRRRAVAMMFSRTTSNALLLAGLLGCADDAGISGPTRADRPNLSVATVTAPVIYSNFGPGMTYDTDPFHGWGINGFLSPTVGQQAISHQFTPTTDTWFGSAQVALSLVTGPGIVDVFLQADQNGKPGPVLERIAVSGLGQTPGIFTATSVLLPRLAQGVPYWLTVAAGAAGLVGGWNWNSIGDASAANFAVTQAGVPTGPWGIVSGPVRSAFQINGPSTPQAVVSALITEIGAMASAGTLSAGQAHALIAKLTAAIASLDAGRSTPACNQLDAVVNQVNAFVRSGTLDVPTGQQLLNSAGAATSLAGCFAPPVADVTPPTGSITAGPASNSVFTSASAVGQYSVAASDDMSGFGPTPLNVIVTRTNFAGGTACVIGSGFGCTVPAPRPLTFDVLNGAGAPVNEGYYTVTITLVDQAGNATNLVAGLVFLLDDPAQIAPGASTDIGFASGIILPPVIVGAATNTFFSTVVDDIDLHSLWGVTTYPTASIRHPSVTLGTYAPPLRLGPFGVNYAVGSWVRCLNAAGDFATTSNRPTHIALTVEDQAFNTSTQTSPPLGPNAEFCGSVGNEPINSFGSITASYGVGKTQVDLDGVSLSPTSSTAVALSVVADVPVFTSANPFSRVDFYYQAPAGYLVLIGISTGVLNQTPASRYWTYDFTWDPDANVPVGAVNVVAFGVDAQGDAVLSNALGSVFVVTVP
jgi:hypothetical protein